MKFLSNPFFSLAALLASSCVHPIGAQEVGSQEVGQQAGLIMPVVRVAQAVSSPDAESSSTFGDAANVELPASITQPNGVLSLAPAGMQLLPALPRTGFGCNACAEVRCEWVRCQGPIYQSCTPRIYYATDPRDDDPILTLYPRINDSTTNHWYSSALKMVLRKKAATEAIK